MNFDNNLILLVLPNTRWFNRRPWLILPHAPLILTSILKPNFNFNILDANIRNLSVEETKFELENLKPSVVLISGVGSEYWKQYHEIAKISKSISSKPIVVMGGVYPTVLTKEASNDVNIDYVFIGHAEGRICEFLNSILKKDFTNIDGISYKDNNGEVHINPLKSTIFKSVLVQPDYSLMDLQSYIRQPSKDYQFNSATTCCPIISSYGCPFNCNFCAARTIHGQGVAYRSVRDVISEIKYLLSNGVKSFVFLDDCLTANKKRFNELLAELFLIKNQQPFTWKIASVAIWQLSHDLIDLMSRSGCSQITVSIESGSQRVLKEIMHKPLKLDNKIKAYVDHCHNIGMDIGANYVIGSPGETWREIRETFKHAETMNYDLVHFHIATPLPKTQLYETAKSKGYLPEGFSFFDDKFFGYGRGWITTEEFTPKELEIVRSYEYDRINFSTPEKELKIANMMCISVEELRNHVKQTRRNCGIYI